MASDLRRLTGRTHWIAFEVLSTGGFSGGLGTYPAYLQYPLSANMLSWDQGTTWRNNITWWNGINLSLAVRIEAASVPLPSALLLFGPGFAGIAAIRRRFKRFKK